MRNAELKVSADTDDFSDVRNKTKRKMTSRTNKKKKLKVAQTRRLQGAALAPCRGSRGDCTNKFALPRAGEGERSSPVGAEPGANEVCAVAPQAQETRAP